MENTKPPPPRGVLLATQQPTLNASAEHKCDDGTESDRAEYTRLYTTTAPNSLSNDRLLNQLYLLHFIMLYYKS